MPDDAALGVSGAARLDLAHREARRARRDDYVGRQQLVELSIELLLEIDPLGPILLDKVRALDPCRNVGLEGQLGLGRAWRKAQSLGRRPGRFDKALQGSFCIRRDIGRHDLQTVREEEGRPARANDASADDGHAANRLGRHGQFSFG
jgi:hypothetical protein